MYWDRFLFFWGGRGGIEGNVPFNIRSFVAFERCSHYQVSALQGFFGELHEDYIVSIPGKELPGTGAGGGQCGIATVGCSWTAQDFKTPILSQTHFPFFTFDADRFRKTQNYTPTTLILPYLFVNSQIFYLWLFFIFMCRLSLWCNLAASIGKYRLYF